MNKKSTILTIIITSIFTATITCTCIFIINNHNNNDFVEEITSNLSTAQIQREVETTNTTIESTKEKSTVESTTTTTAPETTTAVSTTATTVTTAHTTTTTTTTSTTAQTLRNFEIITPKSYDYFIHDNIFHDTKCQIALDLYRNGDSNSYGVGIDGFTSLPYTVDQMIEQGYIPCEKCIKR